MSWNMNVDGFQSAVAYAPSSNIIKVIDGVRWSTDRKGKALFALPESVSFDHKDLGHTSHLLVRARISGDLDKLAAYDPESVRFESLSADYQYRLIVRREAFAKYNYDLSMGIDYDSHVKEEMNRRSPKAEGRMNAYYSIWTALSRIQPNPPYGARSYGSWDWDSPKKKGAKKAKKTTGTTVSKVLTTQPRSKNGRFGKADGHVVTTQRRGADGKYLPKAAAAEPMPASYADDPEWIAL
jgi:hypothetical protein